MQALFFDLDGTLSDPWQGITRSIRFALDRLGCPQPSQQALKQFIGPPLRDSFAALLNTRDPVLVEQAVEFYRERFAVHGLFENTLYPGIENILVTLQNRGHKLYVVTTKPTVYARKIIGHFALDRCFQNIYGSELDGSRAAKTALIAHVLKQEKISAQDAIMIGDRKHDSIGARNNRIAAAGVLWGYGARQELELAGIYKLFEKPEDLLRIADSVIRPASLHDAAAASTCVRMAYRHYISRIGKPPNPMLDDYAHMIDRHFVFVMIEAHKLVGVLVLVQKTGGLLLDNIAIDPAQQGKGRGTMLMDFAEREARRLGYNELNLYTHEKMTENISRYLRLGYAEIERRREAGYARVYMRKKL